MALPEKKDKVKGVSDRKAAPDGKWRKDYQKIRESLGKVTDLVGVTHHGHVTKRLPSLIFNIMIKNVLLYVGVLVISFSSTKVATDECLSFLKSGAALGVDLSERELCILATAVVEIKQKYKIDPMQIPLVIQVA